MNTEGNSHIPGNGSDPRKADSDPHAGGSDDGDFDLSGFSDADSAPSPGAAKPAGERKAPKASPKGPAKGPRAGASRGYESTGRGYGDRAGGPREGGGPRGAGGAKGYGPRAGGPRGGAGGSRDYGSRDGGPRGAAGGPREGGPRGVTGGPRGAAGGPREYGAREGGFRKDFADRGPRSGDFGPRGGDFKPRFSDRGPRGEDNRAGGGDRPFRPRTERPAGPGGERPPRRFAPRPGIVPAAPEGQLFRPVSTEVKPWLSLKQDKGRWKESRFLLEGAKNIADALETSPAMLHMAFVAPDFKEKDLLATLKKHRVAVVPVSADDIRALSDTETPQGIVAVCNFATLKLDWNKARYITVLDGVQDPGNVGAIFRTSLALGMDALVLGKGSCDPYNPKVVRSSVGALLGMPFETGEELGSKIGFLRQKGFSVVATSSHAKQTLEQAKLRKKVALIVGNEGAGTGASYLDMADAVVKIPLKSKVESLNVAVAHGILSYQLIHGRE